MPKSTTDLAAAGAITGAEGVKLVQGGVDVQAPLAALFAAALTVPEFTAAAAPNGTLYRLLRFGANSFWHYRTADLNSVIDNIGYFNALSGHLVAGDFIFATCGITGTPATGIFIVKSNAAGVVDLANLADLGSLNPD